MEIFGWSPPLVCDGWSIHCRCWAEPRRCACIHIYIYICIIIYIRERERERESAARMQSFQICFGWSEVSLVSLFMWMWENFCFLWNGCKTVRCSLCSRFNKLLSSKSWACCSCSGIYFSRGFEEVPMFNSKLSLSLSELNWNCNTQVFRPSFGNPAPWLQPFKSFAAYLKYCCLFIWIPDTVGSSLTNPMLCYFESVKVYLKIYWTSHRLSSTVLWNQTSWSTYSYPAVSASSESIEGNKFCALQHRWPGWKRKQRRMLNDGAADIMHYGNLQKQSECSVNLGFIAECFGEYFCVS